MKPPPPDWPQISCTLWYEDDRAAIDWLCRAFGFEVRLKVEGDDGQIHHCELVYGQGVVMIGEARSEKFPQTRAPAQVGGGNTQNLMVYVDDVEAHCARAREAGGVIVNEPKTSDYGEEYWSDRSYECRDLGGHHWWFCQRLRSPKKA